MPMELRIGITCSMAPEAAHQQERKPYLMQRTRLISMVGASPRLL